MHEQSWEHTILDEVHRPLKRIVSFDSDEHPLISFFADDQNWTVYSTSRLIGSDAGSVIQIGYEEFSRVDFGDFKGDLDSPRIHRAKIRFRDEVISIFYESSYASMAPIHYFKFWNLKWPVWKETYRLMKATETQNK